MDLSNPAIRRILRLCFLSAINPIRFYRYFVRGTDPHDACGPGGSRGRDATRSTLATADLRLQSLTFMGIACMGLLFTAKIATWVVAKLWIDIL